MALDTSKLFRKEYHPDAIFWGTPVERSLVKDLLINTIHPSLFEQWPKLKCYCACSPKLDLCKKSDPQRVYLKCGSNFKSKLSCYYFQWVDQPLKEPIEDNPLEEPRDPSEDKALPPITNLFAVAATPPPRKRKLSKLEEPCEKESAEEKPEDVAPPNATNPFAVSAREQQRKRKLIKPATLNLWGTPQPEGKVPYLAITEDGLAITQDGSYAMYKAGMTVASPRFKQLYQYHKSQPFHHTAPVTEEWLEGRYGPFVLPLESIRRRRLLDYHNTIKQTFEKMFSMEELEKKHGHKVKNRPNQTTHRYEQLFNFYKKQYWQVDMPVTEEWLEKSYGKSVPKEAFALSERYTSLLALQPDLKVFEKWLERVYGPLVPRSLSGRRLYHLMECFHQNKNLILTDTALEHTYGPLVPAEPLKKEPKIC